MQLGKAIQQARVAKKLTQAKLAQAINEKPAVINQYENGKAIPNGQVSLLQIVNLALCCFNRHTLTNVQFLTYEFHPFFCVFRLLSRLRGS